METKVLTLVRSVAHIFILYGLIVLLMIGPFHIFNFFYLLAGTCLLLVCIFRKKIEQRLSKRLLSVLIGLFVLLCVFFLFIEARILSCALTPYEKDADYVIVLGSHINEEGPSKDYQARLDSAYDYLTENEKSLVVCTGAKGPYEPLSEAKGGKDYLMKRGIDASRILTEERSYDTFQNLENAKALIGDVEKQKILIVSADYHLYRAKYLAAKLGYKDVSVKGGHGSLLLLPQYYTREFFALCKEYLFR
ncbi:MAG: YdcF family protein [Erysipelotrichaceae bacterium]|nr:YdcF family protein [Erysipelotrichaceae bacterium]